MKSDEQLWEICKEIYRQMFKEANPSADFDKLMMTGESKKDQFFMKYYLSSDRQDEIIEEILKTHKLRNWEKQKIRFEVHLGCSPNTSEKTWKEILNAENEKRPEGLRP